MKGEAVLKTLMDAISNVFETMFYQPVQFSAQDCSLAEWFSQDYSLCGASIGFSGPFSGVLYLLAPIKVADKITADFLGINEDAVGKDQRNDTMKEAVNMIGGHTLSLFENNGDFRLGIPDLIKESSLSGSWLEEQHCGLVFMETEGSHLAVAAVTSPPKGRDSK